MLKKTLIALAAACLSLYGGLAFAQAPDPDLVAKAEKEGSVLFYTSATEEALTRLANGFQKKYPKIKANFWRAPASEMITRVQAEETSGRQEADIINTSALQEVEDFKKRGALVSYKSPEYVNYYPADVDPDYMFFIPRAFFRVLSYNTAALQGKAPPKDWMDMTDERFKGRVSIQQPMGVGNTYIWRYAMYQLYGDEFIKRLAASDPLVSNSVNTVHERIVSGEALVSSDLSYMVDESRIKLGAPVDAVYPDTGVPISRNPAAILAKAPHPNAARLFMDYLASKEGQEYFNSSFTYSLRKDVENKGLRPLNTIKYIEYTAPELATKFDHIQSATKDAFKLN